VESRPYDVIVVGGGIVGLSSAFGCARRGLRVAVVDASPGSGATRAAAGMLAPGAEATSGEEDICHLGREAVSLWPNFAAEIEKVAGLPVSLEVAGTLCVGWTSADRHEILQQSLVATSFGENPCPVTRENDAEIFTPLSPRISQGIYYPDDVAVDPDVVMSALTRSLEELGSFFVKENARDCSSLDDSVIVTTDGGEFRARRGIIATGAVSTKWSVQNSSRQSLRPVRGSTLRLRLAPQEPRMLRACVDGHHVYVVFRSSGEVVIGASSDESVEAVTETGTVYRLLRDALAILPDLDHATFVEARAGLRPTATTELPFFEILSDAKWAWTSGHYRHGITLAPLVANYAEQFVEMVEC